MAKNSVELNVKVTGDAFEQLRRITGQTEELGTAVGRAKSKLSGLGRGLVVFNQALELVGKAVNGMKEYTDAYRAQSVAETQLTRVMRNTMGATKEEIEGVKALAVAQQKLGVIGDEVQLAGAKELGTYLTKAESLKKLLPVMNDTIAHQFGLNATQEEAVNIATMFGKVMDGQVGALSRYGYKFTEAQEKVLKFGTEEERLATLIEVVTPIVGGMNEALAATPEGQVQKVSMAMGDVRERIGEIITRVEAKLVPTALKVLKYVDKLIDIVNTGWPVWGAAILGATVGVLALSMKVKALGLSVAASGGMWPAMAALAKASCASIGVAIKSIPIVGWIAAAVALIVGVFAMLWNKSLKFRNWVMEAVETVANFMLAKLNFILNIYNKIAEKLGWKTVKPLKVQLRRYSEKDMPGKAGSGMDELGGLGMFWGVSGLGSGAEERVARGTEAAVTGGTRSTTVNINLGKMVENIVFNGTLGENAQELENKIQEILTRTLMMAAATA